jgi:alkylhydroperoxidase family enzyme
MPSGTIRILWDIGVAIAIALILGIAFTVGLLLPNYARAQDPKPAAPRFPSTDNEQTWKQLPRIHPPLPAWARILVAPLPRTTGAMLELDYLHRGRNPLGPRLAGVLRWAAADEIGCTYAKRYAEADLRQAGHTATARALSHMRLDAMTNADRLAVTFARKLTRAASTVTDEEVAELVKQFGPEQVVAMVHTLAHANFQNRIFLALGVEVEAEGPLPPLDLQLDPKQRAKVPTPPRPPWQHEASAADPALAGSSPKWRELSLVEVRQALEEQKKRQPRIAAPPGAAKGPPIVWTQVSMGYQPALTKAWFDCMRTFQQEAKLDSVFSNTVFWVITRSNECFY